MRRQILKKFIKKFPEYMFCDELLASKMIAPCNTFLVQFHPQVLDQKLFMAFQNGSFDDPKSWFDSVLFRS